MAEPPQEWVKTALQVTGHFEDSDDPLGAVTGDFDGMGISLGVLQWNIGSNSLQSMVAAVGRDYVIGIMPQYGEAFWEACGSDVRTGLAICRRWQQGGRLEATAQSELGTFTRSDPFVAQQVARASKVARTANSAAEAYAAKDPGYVEPTKALFCWFFDLITQNGGLKGLGYDDVSAFLERNGKSVSGDVICDWLASRPKGMAGYRDSDENARIWRNAIPDGQMSLFVLSYLRSQLSRPEFRADVMNRKATIALQHGWVHREKHDLAELLK